MSCRRTLRFTWEAIEMASEAAASSGSGARLAPSSRARLAGVRRSTAAGVLGLAAQ